MFIPLARPAINEPRILLSAAPTALSLSNGITTPYDCATCSIASYAESLDCSCGSKDLNINFAFFTLAII
ncbi:MAG: LEPR-XLL domain-containing protein [Colwellia sp.]|nr:LEPR-XLL domain-containing protein [Colwellia sp.]